MGIDSNIEFVLHSGKRVRFMRPLQIGYNDGYHNLINISVPELMDEHSRKKSYGSFFAYQWVYRQNGYVDRTDILTNPAPIRLSEIAKWSSVEPTTQCEIGCACPTNDHGGRCDIDPLKYVLAKGVSKQQLRKAFENYLDSMPMEDYIRYMKRVLGESVVYKETLAIIKEAEKL